MEAKSSDLKFTVIDRTREGKHSTDVAYGGQIHDTALKAKASWVSFFQWLRGRGLEGVKLIVGDKCLGMLEAVGEVFPEAKYQRCVVHFYRNVFSAVPKSKVKNVAKMLKAIHAQESKKASREKAAAVDAELKVMKLTEAAKKKEADIAENRTVITGSCFNDNSNDCINAHTN